MDGRFCLFNLVIFYFFLFLRIIQNAESVSDQILRLVFHGQEIFFSFSNLFSFFFSFFRNISRFLETLQFKIEVGVLRVMGM